MLHTPVWAILTFHLTPEPPLKVNRLLLKVRWTKFELSMFKVMLFCYLKWWVLLAELFDFSFTSKSGGPIRPLTIWWRKSVTHMLVWCVHGVYLHFLYGVRWAEWKRGLFYYTVMVSCGRPGWSKVSHHLKTRLSLIPNIIMSQCRRTQSNSVNQFCQYFPRGTK